MNITSSIPATSYQPGLTIKKLDETKRDVELEDVEAKQAKKKLDLRNVSMKDLQELLATVDFPPGLMLPIIIPPNVAIRTDDYMNHKVDYLAQLENAAARTGNNTKWFKDVLAVLKPYHSPSSNTTVAESFKAKQESSNQVFEQEILWANTENLEQERLEFLLKTT